VPQDRPPRRQDALPDTALPVQIRVGRAGLGLVGGPLLFVSATAVLFGAYRQVSPPGAVAALPVFAWELGLAFFLILKGFKTTALDRREAPLITQAAAVAA